MSYINDFGHALLKKLSPHLLNESSSVTRNAQSFHRGNWRSDVQLFPWNLKTDDKNSDGAQVLFVDVTFDVLRQRDDINVAVRVGALLAIPKLLDGSVEKHAYHYVQSAPLTESAIYRHCKSIDVDITTKAEMVADFLGEAFLGGMDWYARIVDSKQYDVDSTEHDSTEYDSPGETAANQWELRVKHVNQLEGEVGYLPLSDLGASIDKRTVDMILLSGKNQTFCQLSEEEGKHFWRQCGILDTAILQSSKKEVLGVDVDVSTKSKNDEINTTIRDPKIEDTACKERKRPTKTADSTVYAQSRRTYIAGSKRKKPKFTLGSL